MASPSTRSNLKERQLLSIPPISPKSFQTLIPNRFDTIHLHDETNPTTYRYRLTVLDRPVPTTSASSRDAYLRSITHPVAVFLIPAGRESEYLFRTYKGLEDVAKSANCARLIAVAFHRDHVYDGGQRVVQEELEFAVQSIAQRGSFMYVEKRDREWYLEKVRKEGGRGFSIPFMALDGLGKRNVVAEGDGGESLGPFWVEEVQVDGGETVRRLYFQSNENLVQTEMFLKKDGSGAVDPLKLAFDYHRRTSVGILVLGGFLRHSLLKEGSGGEMETEKPQSVHGLVIGLGGGALVNFLAEFVPASHVTAVELEQAVVKIAKSHFGFRADDNDERVDVVVGDGLAVHAAVSTEAEGNSQSVPGEGEKEQGQNEGVGSTTIEFPPQSLRFVVIDADSKDKGVGMSCPPEAFVSPSYLSQIYELLSDNGVLAINVVARDPEMLRAVETNVRGVFEGVFISREGGEDGGDECEDLNVVLFGTKKLGSSDGDRKGDSHSDSISSKLDTYAISLRDLCDSNGLTGRELVSDLVDCIGSVKQIGRDDTDNIKAIDQSEKQSSKSSVSSSKKKKKGGGKKKKGKKR